MAISRTVIVPTLPDYSRHRIGHNKQYQSKMHHDRHFGPFFEDPLNTSGTLQLKFHEGTESILNCRVGMLKDKTVMWQKYKIYSILCTRAMCLSNTKVTLID